MNAVNQPHHALSLALTLAVGTALGACGTWFVLWKRVNPRQQQNRPLTFSAAVSGERLMERTKDREAFYKEMERLRRTDPNQFKQAQASGVLLAQMSLGRFGYGTRFTEFLDEETRKAIREYQARNKLPVTGDVDFDTIQQLNADDNILAQSDLFLPKFWFYADFWDKGYFDAEGSWIKEGNKNPSPETSEIQCLKDKNVCFEAKALPDGDGAVAIASIHQIARWDRFEIVTVPDEFPCARETMEINRSDKSILTISRAVYKAHQGCQEVFGAPRTTVFRLSNGEEISKSRNSAKSRALQGIMQISEEALRLAGPSNSK